MAWISLRARDGLGIGYKKLGRQTGRLVIASTLLSPLTFPSSFHFVPRTSHIPVMQHNMSVESIDEVIRSDVDIARRSASPGLSKTRTSLRQDHVARHLQPESEHETGTESNNNSAMSINRGSEVVNKSSPNNALTQTRTEDDIKKQTPGLMDFFGAEVFQLVMHNPTTAFRFLRFCQTRACGENIEFLEKVFAYNRLLDETTKLLAEIHSQYVSVESPRQINLPHRLTKRVTHDIKSATQSTIPAMEGIFSGAQDHVEGLLASDIYPRFVKHQITTSATVALADDISQYQGLGDCFCLTDPSIADNPIRFASDGFVEVTGYSRRDIVPRNCRFLQGPLTDRAATKRLQQSISNREETVELLLNYRKNGEPFWNLLYVSPLYNQQGNVAFFLGGQINCSTTVHSYTDILRILSLNDEGFTDRRDLSSASLNSGRPPSDRFNSSSQPNERSRSNFFKSFRINRNAVVNANVRHEVGMEGDLVNKLGKLSLKTQVEAFYTAYSKYLVLKWTSSTSSLTVSHFSPSSIDLLCLNLPNGSIAPIFNKDIFKILSEHAQSSSEHKSLKYTVKENVKNGRAVSMEMGLLTGIEVRRGGFGGRVDRRVEERYVGHWTPMKDEQGRSTWVVLTIAPK